jgi:MFS family permease
MLCPLFIGEIASHETRGALVALEQLSIVLGVVLGFWVGFATRSLPGAISWRLPLGIQIFPGVVLAGGSILLPESPRMLVLRGEEKEAAASLERLRNRVGSNDPLVQVSSVFGRLCELTMIHLLQLELAEMRLEAILVKESNAQGESNWRNLLSPKLLPRTSIGVTVMFFQREPRTVGEIAH